MDRRQIVSTVVALQLVVATLSAGTIARADGDPLATLRAQLPSLASEQPVRLDVEVTTRHRGSGPLHLRQVKKTGTAIVLLGKHGPEVREQRWLGTETRLGAGSAKREPAEVPFLTEADAADLVEPAKMLQVLLDGATLLADERVELDGKPSRRLAFRPGPLAPRSPNGLAEPGDAKGPFVLKAQVWLDDAGVPVALERSFTLELDPVLGVRQQQWFRFRQVDGRLLVEEAEETYTGTALAVFRGRDDRSLRVVGIPAGN